MAHITTITDTVVVITASHIQTPSHTRKTAVVNASANSADAHTTSAPQTQTATSRATPNLQAVAKEPNSLPSATTKPPVIPCVKLAVVGLRVGLDTTKSLGVRTVPVTSGSNQSSRPTSGPVTTNTADGYVVEICQNSPLDKIKKGKANFYIMQYPGLRIVQSALHFTSLIDLFTQTPSRLLWEASSDMLQLMREGCSYTYPPLSIARYSFISYS